MLKYMIAFQKLSDDLESFTRLRYFL